MNKNWAVVVGLTGGIGSGKSTVLQMMKQQGAFTLDADAIVRKALEKDFRVLTQIKKKFGPTVFDAKQQINKKKLAELIFGSPANRRKLERILHPLVRQTMKKELASHRGQVAVCDIPLLFETGQSGRYDWVVVVNATDKVRIARLLKKKFSPSDIQSRMKSQWPLSRKCKKADFVIHNNGSKQQTKIQVEKLMRGLHGISTRTKNSK